MPGVQVLGSMVLATFRQLPQTELRLGILVQIVIYRGSFPRRGSA